MLAYAAIDLVSVLPLVIGVLGLAGLVFTALRYQRDDTTAVVSQQAQITSEMKTLNDELRTTTTGLREERDELRGEVNRLSGQVDVLRDELREAHAQISGKMTRIERKLDDGG
jgi:uncharacterized coiled-coil DUF342 family protein